MQTGEEYNLSLHFYILHVYLGDVDSLHKDFHLWDIVLYKVAENYLKRVLQYNTWVHYVPRLMIVLWNAMKLANAS